MLILDTDHLTGVDRDSEAGSRLVQRLDASGEEVAITIVSVEEQLRGWLAQIGRLQDPHKQIAPYWLLQLRVVVVRFMDGAALDAGGRQDFRAIEKWRRPHR